MRQLRAVQSFREYPSGPSSPHTTTRPYSGQGGLFSILLLALPLLFASCASTVQFRAAETDWAATRYPILLIHGIGFHDSALSMSYWGELPGYLRAHGANVFTSDQDAYGLIADNAAELKAQIQLILLATDSDKINLIGHSRGGLEARYLVSRLDMDSSIASVTTISTPHRGSAMADYLTRSLTENGFTMSLLNHIAEQGGDRNPDSYISALELTREAMKKFNTEVPDVPGIYYQSWAGRIYGKITHPFWKRTSEVMRTYGEGENDGLVSVESAKWGEYRGLISEDHQVSHADETAHDTFLMLGDCADMERFYLGVVHELKQKGY